MSDSETNDALERLAHEMAQMQRAAAERAANDRVRERAFDQLYEELQQYKEDFVFKAERPLLLDLLLFYDSLNWFQESLINQEMSRDVIEDSFQYMIDEFLEILYRRDVVPMGEAPTFDRTKQKAVKVVSTTDPRLDRKVTQVLKRGFERGERVLRSEEVVIMRLDKTDD